MSSLVSQVENVENKVRGLIHSNERLKLMLEAREETVQLLQSRIEELERTVEEKDEKTIALRTANAMLGSNDYKTKTKLRINALVREIDQCIAQLT